MSGALTKVGVFGAHGRMGTEVVSAVSNSDDMELVATVGSDDQRTEAADVDVIVDFTHQDVVMENLRFAVQHGIHTVIGTSGFDEAKLAAVRELLAEAPDLGVLVAPNFALGAVLSMRFAQLAARYYDSAEVIEMHHNRKVDAPSGTAAHTARMISHERAQAGLTTGHDATTSEVDGARGATIDDVPVHSVRLPGLVAHKEVLFGGAGETLTIRHDSLDRASFMPGVLLGVRSVLQRPGLTVGLENLLE